MPQRIENPLRIIRDTLDANWNTGDTIITSQPPIHTGWYRGTLGDPQISVSNTDESTSERGIEGTGNGSILTREGTVLVNVWAGTDDTDGEHAQDVSYSLAQEVEDILQNKTTGTLDDSGVRELDSVTPVNPRSIVDTDGEEPEYRHQIVVEYYWRKEPE